jgi:hypothetical protein
MNKEQKDIFSKGLQMKDLSIMSVVCKTCMDDFTSHSFNRIGYTLEGGHIFYTKISNASKYDDTEGIVNHCSNYLNTINPDKWSWIMDFDGFGLRHTLGINTGLRLSDLINKVGRLQYMIVINTNIFVEQMLSLTKLTLNKEYHDCIKIVHSNDTFMKKIKEEWHSIDNSISILNSLID